jgi:hypothetical protein
MFRTPSAVIGPNAAMRAPRAISVGDRLIADISPDSTLATSTDTRYSSGARTITMTTRKTAKPTTRAA